MKETTAGEARRHDTPEHRWVAAQGTILRVLAGSAVHGTATGDGGDRDEAGVCIEPPQYVSGLRLIGGRPFEQWQHHTANRSGPGDLDVTVYSLRKFMRLLLGGNPSVLIPLFVPQDAILVMDEFGRQLLDFAPHVASRRAGERFLGYLDAQRRAMLSRDGKGRDVTRPELVREHGYDVKFASHMLRLAFQGIEYVTTGRLTLPMPAQERESVIAVRTGQLSLEHVLLYTASLEGQLRRALASSPLPDGPDAAAADALLTAMYLEYWQLHAPARSFTTEEAA